jgi:hypothetical protein
MEAEVSIDERVAFRLLETLDHLLDRLVHSPEVLGTVPLGRERRRLAFENRTELDYVVQPAALVEREQQTQGAVQGVRGIGHDECPAVDRADDPLRLEHAQRLAHR